MEVCVLILVQADEICQGFQNTVNAYVCGKVGSLKGRIPYFDCLMLVSCLGKNNMAETLQFGKI